MKRCKKCLVFSGANIAIQVQCGSQTRIIRSDILDKDMFDPAPNTPEHTSWTMALLARLDAALGPGVMDKPVFPTGKSADAPAANSEAEILSEIGVGKFDELFRGAPDKPSDLYRASHSYPASPTVRLLSSTPFQPVAYVQPEYPPLAKFAHVSGSVIFDLVVDSNGKASNFAVESGQPLLRGAVEKSVANWKFPNEAAGQKIHATIEFATNCSPNPSKR
ncbi:MAG: energy transducer TonB [Terriglobales bacterium]